MRTWLYNRVRGILGMNTRVISSGAADNPGPPFIVIGMGVEQADLQLPPESKAQSVPFTIWVHDTPGSMLYIDDTALALKNGIPSLDGFKIGGLSVLEVRWIDTGQDGFDDHWKTNCRPVRFTARTAH